MKKLKLILPMLAFIFAIGMSFAFVNSTPEDYYVTGFIELDNTWYQVEVECEITDEECVVKLEGDEDEIEHLVYDAPNGDPVEDGNLEAQSIPDPRAGS